MVNQLRFWLYRNLVALLELLDFKKTEIIPLAPPADRQVRFRPFSEAHPGMPIRGLHEAVTYPLEDRAEPRLREIRSAKLVLSFLSWIAPRHTPPVPATSNNSSQSCIRAASGWLGPSRQRFLPDSRDLTPTCWPNWPYAHRSARTYGEPDPTPARTPTSWTCGG